MENLIVASANKGKIAEIKQMLGGRFNVKSIADMGVNIEVEETGATFEENAVIKAQAIYDILKQPVLSDDSGLEVSALNGEPGVYSARYAGLVSNDAKNNQKLLKKMTAITDRAAKFVSVIAFIDASGKTITARGETKGEILNAPLGENGFGYDPLFYSYDLKKSFGQATQEEKNCVSHRYKALKNLLDKLVLNI